MLQVEVTVYLPISIDSGIAQ